MNQENNKIPPIFPGEDVVCVAADPTLPRYTLQSTSESFWGASATPQHTKWKANSPHSFAGSAPNLISLAVRISQWIAEGDESVDYLPRRVDGTVTTPV